MSAGSRPSIAAGRRIGHHEAAFWPIFDGYTDETEKRELLFG